MTFEELFDGQPMDLDAIVAGMQKTAAQFGLPFVKQDRIYNTHRAQALGIWAQSLGKGAAFHTAAFDAYFGQAQNLADQQVLCTIAGTAGLDTREAEKILTDKRYDAMVTADWKLARERDIMAVPTLFANGRKQVGAQSYKAMEIFLGSIGAMKKAAV